MLTQLSLGRGLIGEHSIFAVYIGPVFVVIFEKQKSISNMKLHNNALLVLPVEELAHHPLAKRSTACCPWSGRFHFVV